MKNGYSHIFFLIDRSGSMINIRRDVIEGFNDFLSQQKKEQGELTVSMAMFDTTDMGSFDFNVINHFTPISQIPDLSFQNFIPRGGTPLNDAVGRAIDTLGKDLSNLPEALRPEKVMMIIVTDGEENASREFNDERIRDMVKHQEEKYNWKFIYLGANQDSKAEASKRGFSGAGNYQSNSKGVKAAFMASGKLSSYARKADLQSFTGTNYNATVDTFMAESIAEVEQEELNKTVTQSGLTSTTITNKGLNQNNNGVGAGQADANKNVTGS